MSYYGWRDIGTGLARRGPGVNVIDISSSSSSNVEYNNNSRYPSDKYFCSTCGCKLIYSDKIKKWFCPEHGCNLTLEDKDKLSNKPSSIIPEATAPTTVTSPFDDIEPGVGGGFVPMQRDTGTTGNAGTGGGGASGVILPMGDRRRRSRYSLKPGEYRTPNGDIIELDAEQQKRVGRGYVITEATTTLYEPTGDGTMKTMTTDELRRQKEEDSYYDGRYDSDRSSGLNVRKSK